ncbi:MAG: hypothetical protein GF320_09205 [Armatimonadia bacterium]|nr:hypothetical protein [Armatimonadia bacterium]
MKRRRGVALVSVLWVLAVLSVMSLGFALTVRVHTELTSNGLMKAKAEGLAQTGLEMTFELYYADLAEGKTYNAPDDPWMAYGSEDLEMELEDGTFSIRVMDEAGKLNVNLAGQEELLTLTGDEDLTAAILDWRDADDDASLGGAESFYYEDNEPPYTARNGRLRSIGELALVQGITPEILWGPDEEQYRERLPGETRGLVDLLTVIAIDSNQSSSTGNPRINLNTAGDDEIRDTLSGIIPDQKIEAILDYRGSQSDQGQGQGGVPGGPPGGGIPGDAQIEQAPPEIEVPPSPEPQVPGGDTGEGGASQAFGTTGELVDVPGLEDEDIQAIWDLVTAQSASVIEGRVNVNTAPLEVLASVIDEDIAQDIVDYRDTRGPFPTVAHVLDVDPAIRNEFAGLSNLLTVRSYVFTIEATGKAGPQEIIHRIRTVVDLSGDEPNYLMVCHY